MSKGSKQRPTDKDKFDANFDRIFGEKKTWATEENASFADLSGGEISYTGDKTTRINGVEVKYGDILSARNAIFEGKK